MIQQKPPKDLEEQKTQSSQEGFFSRMPSSRACPPHSRLPFFLGAAKDLKKGGHYAHFMGE